MALALSIGSVVQTSAVYAPVAYAAQTNVTLKQVKDLIPASDPEGLSTATDAEKTRYTKAKEDATNANEQTSQDELKRIYDELPKAIAGLGAEARTTNSSKETTLKNLVENAKNVKSSERYNAASNKEKTTYDNAITAANTAIQNNKLNNIDSLIENINSAIKNFGANAIESADEREALRLTIKMAEKLLAQETLQESEKQKVRNVLSTPYDAVNDADKTKVELSDITKKLSNDLEKIIVDNKLDVEKLGLNNNDFAVLGGWGNDERYSLKRNELYNEIIKANELINSQAYKNLNDQTLKDSYAKAVENATLIYDNNNSTREALINYVIELNQYYKNVNRKINSSYNSSAELVSKLEELITESGSFVNTDSFKKGSSISKATYNNAISRARTLREQFPNGGFDYEEAIKQIQIAKIALKPVDVVTIDNNTTDAQTEINKIDELLKDKATVEASPAYKNPTLKTAYDNAVTKANNAKTSKKLEDLKAANTDLTNAKAKIAEYNKNYKDLDDSINANKDYENDAKYKASTDALKTEFKTAYNAAVAARDKKESTAVELKTALDNLTKARKDITDAAATLNVLKGYVEEAPTFRGKNEYKNGRSDLKTAYDNAITAGDNLVKKNSTNQADIQKAVADIILAKTNLQTFDKTLEDLNKLVTEKGTYVQTDVYKLASDELKKAYDKAIAAAEDANKNKDTKSGTDIIKAVGDVQTAKNNLDRAVSERKLQALIDEENTVKADTKFTGQTDKTKTDAYNKAIEDAKTLLKNTTRTKEQIEAQIAAINKAKTDLGIATTLPTNTELEAAKNALDALVKNANNIRNQLTFRTAGSLKQAKYNQAIVDGRDLLAKYANDKTSVTTKEFTDAAKKITDALADIGIKSDVTYSTKLEDLIKEAPEFRKQTKFVEKLTGTAYQKQLVATYNELIVEAGKYLDNTTNPDKAIVDTYVTRINEVKMAIMDEMSETELTLRGLVRESTKYITEKAYTDAKNSKDEVLKMAAADYEKLVLDAREVLGKDSRTDTDMKYYVNRIQNAKAVMTDPSAHNLLIYKLAHLIDQAGKVINATTYKDAGQAKRTKLENAIEKAQKITAASADKDIKEAISDLEAALNEPEFRKILNIKEEQKENSDANTRSLQKLTVKELVELARRVTEHPDFKDVPANQVFVLRQALNALNKAITDNDVDAQADAKTRVINALLQDKVIKITEKVLNEKADLSLAEKTLELAKKVRDHDDFKELSTSNQEVLTDAIDKLERAIKSGIDKDIDDAQKALQSVLEGVTFKPIVDKINGVATVDEALIAELRALISTADRVVGHADFKKLDENTKDTLDNALKQAKEAVDSKDEAKVKQAIADLKKALDNEKIKAIIDDLGITAREELEKYIKGDEALRKTVAFTKAQKSLRDNYIKAIDEAKELLKDSKASKDQFEKARANIEAAVKALDGNEFDAKLKALKEEFAENGAKIPDAAKRAEIESKIKALEAADATMDDLITVETELRNALKLTGSSTPVTPTTTPGTTVTPVTTPTTTTTPVTTTSTVPATVNPGSIVRTGIKSLIGVVVLLAVAVAAYFAVTSKDKKNKANNRRPNEEKKTRTFEGDIDNENN